MADSRPNILFMLADDHACQAIGAYGSVVNKTPNLDRIARDGAAFDQSFCCNSICSPSRASILTGKHSHVNGQLAWEEFDGSQTTYPKLLQATGYNTAIVGKWHLKSAPTGFDYWEVLTGQGHYYNPDYRTPDGTARREGYTPDISTDLMLKWLDSGRDPDKPFAAMCHFKAPHRPWAPAPRFFNLFADHDIPVPDTVSDDYKNRSIVLRQNKMQVNRDFYWEFDLKVKDPGPNRHRFMPDAWSIGPRMYEEARMTPGQRETWLAWNERRNGDISTRKYGDEELSRWALQRYLKDYLRCIAAIDDNVGRLLDYLDRTGLAENTLVVYCSDQGFYLGEHGWFDKRWMFEESMWMPLLMRWPGQIEPGTRYQQLVQNIDYAPFLLEVAGLETPDEMHGTSIMPIIKDGDDIHDSLYYHYYDHGGHGVPRHDGVRTDRYKLIHFYSVGEFNLFDLAQDPQEMNSVHENPAYTKVLADMTKLYYELRDRFDVPDEYGPDSA
ncbi:MAG: sulfatase [Lentisphaerae bacterium]|nr:sulfatase [Lentisphaerota bacterium]